MGTFLFSIDLEDVSVELEGNRAYSSRVCQMVERYLTLLQKYGAKATFFSVGEIAREFPTLIKEVADEGHEIGCHSDTHTPLDLLTPDTLTEDLNRSRESLQTAATVPLYGYRAPIFSLTEKTQWVYKVLKEQGFKYSSSVMPMTNPLFGWKSFGTRPKMIDGICEIPVSVFSIATLRFPLAGGVYFRLLPLFIIYRFFKQFRDRQFPVVGYFHPQDCDDSFQKLKYRDYGFIYNFLLNYNKSSVFQKLEYLLSHGFKIIRYQEYIETMNPLKS